MNNQNFSLSYLKESIQIIQELNTEKIEQVAQSLSDLRERGGRLFLLGLGGSAGTASHAVNDFRKLCTIETYSPIDNVSELTARTNDEGFETIFSEWLKVSNLNSKDALFILSVGGGNLEKKISVGIINSIMLAKERGAEVLGIVGKSDGYTAKHGDHVVVIPLINENHLTPHSESFQSIILHLLVSHPLLKRKSTKWEGVSRPS